jgi:hypothetical protein
MGKGLNPEAAEPNKRGINGAGKPVGKRSGGQAEHCTVTRLPVATRKRHVAWRNTLATRSSSLTLQAATRTVSTRPPRVGELVLVRSRRWLVDEVIEAKSPGQTCIALLSCADDDAQGQTLEVLWDYELDRYPPDGEATNWWRRLNKALGTTSSDFVNASLFQIQSACRSPWGGISELSMNAALAMIEAAAPKDEIEAALALQLACTHMAAMAILGKLDSGFGTDRRIAAFGSAAARLLRAYAMQVEVLRRLRNGGQQIVRVEHVHVNDGGQAVIGNVKKQASTR